MSTVLTERIQHSPDFIAFRSKSSLSAYDLRHLAIAVETSYGVFLALDFLSHAAADPTDPRRALINYYDVALRAYLTKGWRYPGKAVKDYNRFLADRFLRFDFERESLTFLDLLRAAPYQWVPEAELRVRTIVIRSPGYISFEGVGNIIKQVRYLIKDIHHRNRQEKEAGEIKLEAARRALDALPSAGRVRGAEMADNATMLLGAGMDELFDLESEGKLEQLDLFLDKDEGSI